MDATKSYFVPDNEAATKKKLDSNTAKKVKPQIKRMMTIERVLIDRVNNLEDFEEMLDDPDFNLMLKLKPN